MIKLDKFLLPEDKVVIKRAVKEAEAETAGEIKVLVVQKSIRRIFFLLMKLFMLNAVVANKVEKRAVREFLSLGIQDTRDRTGVLIMVSLQERRVSVKADKAINEKVEQGTWQAPVNLILKGIKDNMPGIGIANAVKHVGRLLAQHFPVKPDDKNELSDDVELKE